jgi:hypothetical protein
MAYDTQLHWIDKTFSGVNVTSLKKTHASRLQGPKHAELKSVNEASLWAPKLTTEPIKAV